MAIALAITGLLSARFAGADVRRAIGRNVAGGVLVNLFLCGRGAATAHTDPARFTGRVECAAIYWNFIDIIWIVMFIVLYLL